MADQDLTILDENKPNGATEEVAVLDEYQRETRLKLKAWAGIEHDLVTGAHVIPHGTTAPTGTDGNLFYHDPQRELVVKSGGVWRSTAQPTFNYVINGMFNQCYASTAPVSFPGWGFYGTSALLRVADWANVSPYGTKAALLTAVTDYAVLYQNVATNASDNSPFSPYTYWRNKTVTLGAWVYSGPANTVVVRINDGIAGSQSINHPGGGWVWLTVTRKIDPSATMVQIDILVFVTGTDVYVGGVTLVEGHSCPHPLPPGWQGRQGVLHFGHSDFQPATGVTWWYGAGGYTPTSPGTVIRSYVPFDAYVHWLQIFTVNSITSGTLIAQVEYNGVSTPLYISLAGPNQGADYANSYIGAKTGGWNVRVARSGGSGGFFASLVYEEVPTMS